MGAAARLLAEGITAPTVAGGKATLRFSLRSLANLEERYGSIKALGEKLKEIEIAADEFEAPFIAELLFITQCALGDDVNADELAVGPVELYILVMAAVAESFPLPTGGAAEGKAAAPGNGATSTTPPPSSSEGPTPSSGG